MNTGPIDLLAVSPSADVSVLLEAFDTEAVDRYRVIEDSVWTTSVDPRSSDPASLATNAGGSWGTRLVEVLGRPPAVHLYDVTSDPMTGDLLVVGAHDPDTAFVWRSIDAGESWTEDLAHNADGGGYNRFYEFQAARDGRLVVSTTHGSPAHYVLTDGEWIGVNETDLADSAEVKVDSFGQLIHPGRGVVYLLPAPYPRWSATLARDESIWLCDGDAIYLLPPPD